MDWNTASHEAKLASILSVVRDEILPMLERDGGGLDVVDLVEDRKVLVAYTGACASCPMAISGTLGFVQHTLASRVHPDLVVIPVLPRCRSRPMSAEPTIDLPPAR